MGFGLEMIGVAFSTGAAGITILAIVLYFTRGFSEITQAGIIGAIGFWSLGLSLIIASKIIDHTEDKKETKP